MNLKNNLRLVIMVCGFTIYHKPLSPSVLWWNLIFYSRSVKQWWLTRLETFSECLLSIGFRCCFFWLMIPHRNFCRTIIDKQTKFNLVFMLRLATSISYEDTSSGCMFRFESGYLCLFIAYKLRCQFIKSSNIDAKKVLDSTWFLNLWRSTPINTRILTYGLLLWLLAKKNT